MPMTQPAEGPSFGSANAPFPVPSPDAAKEMREMRQSVRKRWHRVIAGGQQRQMASKADCCSYYYFVKVRVFGSNIGL